MRSFFERRLSPALMEKLDRGAELAGLVPAVVSAGLDVHIREDCLHVYSGQSRVLSIERGGFGFVGCIHHKFVVDLCLPGVLNQSGDYRSYVMTSEFVGEYVRSLPQIVRCAADYGKEEGRIEHLLIRESTGAGSPMVLVDRQVQVHGCPGRADMVGVMPLDAAWERCRLMLVELKQGLDPSIPKAAEQIHRYFRVLTEEGKLREEVRRTYQDVVEQKLRLGILPEFVRCAKDFVEVECLVVLHGYNMKSAYLGRLRAAMTQSHPPTWLVVLPEWNYGLPPKGKWEEL